MRILMILVVGLLAVGCLTPEQKQKRLRDSVVGEYERKDKYGDTIKWVFLKNGVHEWYENGKKQEGEFKWSIVDGEIHVTDPVRDIGVLRINTDKSITRIVVIVDGKRTTNRKEAQFSSKKIK